MSIRRKRRWHLEGTAALLEPRTLLTHMPVAEILRVNEVVQGAQVNPYIATTTHGMTLVVWEDKERLTSNLYGRWIDGQGQPIEGQFLVNEEIAGERQIRNVVVDAHGNTLVLWEEGRPWEWTSDRLYLQRFDAAGAKQGGIQTLSEDLIEDRYPYLYALPDGGLVALAVSNQDGSLLYHRFDAEGMLQASANLDNPVNEGWKSSITAQAALTNNGLVITWSEERSEVVSPGNTRYHSRVWARRLDLDGRPIGDDILVMSIADATDAVNAEPRYPGLVELADGGFLAAWSEYIATDGRPLRTLQGRIYNAAGAPQGESFVIDSPALFTTGVQVAPLSNGNLVTFAFDFLPSANRRDRFQILSSVGSPLTDWISPELPDGRHIRPRLRPTSEGGFMVAWDDATGLTGSGEIYIQMFADDGSEEPGGNESIASIDPSLYLDKGDNGLWAFSDAVGEVRLSPWRTEGVVVGQEGRVYIDFAQKGLWTWSPGDEALTLVNAADPEQLIVGPDGSLYVDYGAFGLWRAQEGVFTQLNAANPEGFAATPNGVLFVDFGPYGLWRRGTGGDFAQLNAANPEGLVATPDGVLYVDFGRYGFWRQDASGIVQVNAADPQTMTANADGTVFVDFGRFGLWRWNNGFQKLNEADPTSLLGSPDGTMYVNFGPYGLWAWTESIGIAQIQKDEIQKMAIGGDGLIYVLLGPGSLLTRREATGVFTNLNVAGVHRLFF